VPQVRPHHYPPDVDGRAECRGSSHRAFAQPGCPPDDVVSDSRGCPGSKTNASDMVILWRPVRADSRGRPVAVARHRVYASSHPLLVLDPIGRTKQVASSDV
jgi:hypothetical protein